MRSFKNNENIHKKEGGSYYVVSANPFNCTICLSPLNTVPKKDSEDRRIILDLSCPIGGSINDYVSKDFYVGQKITLSYPGVDQLVSIVKLKERSCLLFQRDLSRAYRQIVMDPEEVSLLGYSFNGNIYFDKVLSFGLRSVAFIVQRVSDSIKYICSILNISIENYVDDLAGADFSDKTWKSYIEHGNVLRFCGLSESLEKASPPFTQMVFIGVLFYSEARTLSVTPESLSKIHALVKEWLQMEEESLKQLQSLIGKLNIVAHCVKPARIFISRQNTCTPQMKKGLQWWFHFLPRYNGVSMMDLEEWSTPYQVCGTDSCLVSYGGEAMIRN